MKIVKVLIVLLFLGIGLTYFFDWYPPLFEWFGTLPGDFHVKNKVKETIFDFPLASLVIVGIPTVILLRLLFWR